MFDVNRCRGVEGPSQLRRHPKRIVHRQGAVSERDVERLGGEVVEGKIRVHALDAGGYRRDDGRMRYGGRDEPFEFGDELMHALGWQVELEKFDGDKPIAIGIERPKHGSQCAGANLMENPERTEGVWRRITRSVRVQ